MEESDEEDDVIRRPVPPKGKLYKGVVLQPVRTRSTIPSKRELDGAQVHTRPTPQSAPVKEGFSVHSRRFADSSSSVGELANTPGPGSYYSPHRRSRESDDASVSKKGMGNGFASQTQRFPAPAPAVYRSPGPGQYYDMKQNSSISLSPPRRRIELTEPVPHEPTPGPGYYEPHDPHYPPPNSQGSSSFLDSSQRLKIISPGDKYSRKLGPGKYDPKDPSEPRTAVASPFKSHTRRGLDLGKSITPGPGAYNLEESSEDFEKPKPYAPGKLLSKSLVHSSSSMFTRAAESKNISTPTPGPGEYTTTDHSPTLHAQTPSPIAPPRIRRHSVPTPPGSSFISQTQRLTLSSAPPTQENIGPGAYHKEMPLVKNSFNANRKEKWV